jgi:hypothetical protein
MSRQLGRQTVFQGPLYQNGYGVGGYFKKLFRWIVPLAEKHIFPRIKSGAQEIGKHIINASSNIAQDVVKGRNIRQSADEHINKAMDSLQQMAESKLAGQGLKRKAIMIPKNTKKTKLEGSHINKNTIKQKHSHKNIIYKDIFSKK